MGIRGRMSTPSRQTSSLAQRAGLLTLTLTLPVAMYAVPAKASSHVPAARASAPVVLDAHRASLASVALTSERAAVVVWSHRPDTHQFHQVLQHTTLRVAVKRSGHPWPAPRVLGHIGKLTAPSVGAESHGRALVAFVNRAGQVLTRTWRDGQGWSDSTRVSGRHQNAFTMSALATDPASGRSALVYATGKSSAGDTSSTLHLAVHRAGGWQRYPLGTASCLDFEPLTRVAIDAQGAVAAAWGVQDAKELCAFTGHAKVAYLPATGHQITMHRFPMSSFSASLVRTPDGIQLFTPREGLPTIIRSADASGGWGDDESVASSIGYVATDAQGDQATSQDQFSDVLSRTWGGPWAPAAPPNINVKAVAVGAGGDVTVVGRHTTAEGGIVESHASVGGTTYSDAAVINDSTRRFVTGNPPSLAVDDQGSVTMIAVLARAQHLTDGALYVMRYSIPPVS
jgi:hypothetical protein